MPRNKRRTLKDGTRVKTGMILLVDPKHVGTAWEGVEVEVLELYDWEVFCKVVKKGIGKGANAHEGREIWFDIKHVLRIKSGSVLVEHLRSLVSVSRK